jgi:putative methyltransferase (TIGR04325 family)
MQLAKRVVRNTLAAAGLEVRRSRPRYASDPVFSSFAQAAATCGGGYRNHELVRLIVEKNKIFRKRLASGHELPDTNAVRGLLALGFVGQATVNIIDFGGSGGYHYSVAKYLTSARIRWHIVDTPEMVDSARPLEDGQLRYFTSLKGAADALDGRLDLAFSSCSLQYMPDPLKELEQLMELNAPRMFLTRTSLSEDGKDYITIRRGTADDTGPGPAPSEFAGSTFAVPLTIVSRDKFCAKIVERYDICTTVREDIGWYNLNGLSVDNFGFYCRSR